MELRANVVGPVSMRLSDFFEDSLRRTKKQVRSSTPKETVRVMNDFVHSIGDIDVQDVRYEHGERFIRYCYDLGNSAATVAKKVRHIKRVFQRIEDRGQLEQHPLRRLKQPKAPKRKMRVYVD